MQLNELAHGLSLDDKYTVQTGRIYLSGIQALVRLLLLQKQRDQAAGLNTAGFVSGYRGSPLGGVDQQLWKARQHLAKHDIQFTPGLNEDLAATSVWGSQQVNLYPQAKYDGVFGLWYGKGPGVDRSMDVLKHANAAGTSRHGGVIVVCGDDHGAKSSTLPHQSEHVLKAAGIPVFYPATVQEYLDMGIHAYAMSRYTGLWVGFKVVTDVVEASASVEVDPLRVNPLLPTDFILPPDGLNIRWPDTPLAMEARLLDYKLYAALAYARANQLNQIVIDSPRPRLGIMTAGKAYLDVRQALDDLGLDDGLCAELGIRLMKVGMTWPLDAQHVREFATGLEEILVVEEKRQLLEYQVKEELYNWQEHVRPKVYGKFDEKEGGEYAIPQGNWLLPAHAELSPALIAKALARRLENFSLPSTVRERIAARIAVIDARERALAGATPLTLAQRQPWFCSGCPHNTSTRVPEGSRAIAGIGCHYMAMWMDRSTETPTQMGGEGVTWIGQAPFTHEKHVFVNLGDGTYFHSGLLAIRAAIAAKVNLTYKILYNDAVAMTGGQPVDGTLTVPQLVQQVAAEGVAEIVLMSDDIEKYAQTSFASGSVPFSVRHRDELDAVQTRLRECAGTSILIYDQTCAAEKRRRRKKNTPEKIVFPDPPQRVVINDAVCEGCGDCSAQSNCLSIEPLETPFGRKRTVNQSSCNKDFSCLKGFCPSFVTVKGGKVRAAKGLSSLPTPSQATPQDTWPSLPEPTLIDLDQPAGYAYYKYAYGILVTGIGGTGVVTIGQLLGMAAHLEGKGCTVLDMAGLAQKGGSVYSHVQIASTPAHLFATRIATGDADVVLGCDLVVAGSDEALSKMQPGRTHVVANTGETPTADFIHHPDWQFPGNQMVERIQGTCGQAHVALVNATELATALLGDAIYTNPFMLGFAWQKGWIPLTEAALLKAIELNGAAVAKNQTAFLWGRRAAHDLVAVKRFIAPSQVIALARPTAQPPEESLAALIAHRRDWLTQYQDAAYATGYQQLVNEVKQAEERIFTAAGDAQPVRDLSLAVARYYAKLLAYKDEYEVARLYTETGFIEKVASQFEGDYQLEFHLAPPILGARDPHTGLPRKQRFGPWMMKGFKLLAKMKGLRGTPFDVFGYTEERRRERQLAVDYAARLRAVLTDLSPANYALAVEIACLPEQVRGFGHVKARHEEEMQQTLHALWAKWQAAIAAGSTGKQST
ncbi:indolepyruvate ferredoxin oxidoreductase family protein [Parvibium lacunae]|uniref:Indolepyruvate ferredoxin oxidoreductase family protein n=1 Tax=Parvibium lacunae TaxID=1888893 RepID=A0A368L1E6_9BURK|nr:indolepyruvate ferredoxin oxidoreductase family protein [Parvibium lacunae]RCS57154.1 indolepyruvate ferredoxin oxidoreductase family protein [Parvibium lacunae]